MIFCREAASPRPFFCPRTSVHIPLLAATLEIASVAFSDRTFNVDTVAGQIGQDVSDGLCQATNGSCSLRAAVMQANNLSGAGTARIRLPAGTYTQTRPATGSAGEDNGDLNFTTRLAARQVISTKGVSAANSVIDANHIDRVISIDQNLRVIVAEVDTTLDAVEGDRFDLFDESVEVN
ncbi:MAG: hypothetical protein ABIQ70_04820 [Dokdonella sp.]